MRGNRRLARSRKHLLARVALPVLLVLALAGSGAADVFVPGPVVDVTSGNAANTGGVVVPPEWSDDATLVYMGLAPDGSRVLRKVNADGSGQADIATIAPSGFLVANIAVRGSQIAFVSPTGPSFPLKLINLDGTRLTQLVPTADDTPAKFSPDGSQIAFTQGGAVKLVSVAAPGAPVALQSPATN